MGLRYTGGLEVNRLLLWLMLIRVGQELGADTPLAKAVAALIDAAITTIR